MPINHPYDPRHNAKIYIPKLTEEQRLARATPLESLRRPRPTVPTAILVPKESAREHAAQTAPVPQDVPVSQDIPAPEDASSTHDSLTPHDMPMTQDVHARFSIPTAHEVVFAEFPKIFAPRRDRANWATHANDSSAVSTMCLADVGMRDSDSNVRGAPNHPGWGRTAARSLGGSRSAKVTMNTATRRQPRQSGGMSPWM